MSEVAVVSENGQDLLESFEEGLEEVIQSRTHPAEKRIRFGNLRSEISRSSNEGEAANAAG